MLAALKQAGFEFWLKANGSVGVKPVSKLTAEQMDYLRQHKAAIVAELAQTEIQSVSTLSIDQEKAIRAWLSAIGEVDQAMIAETLARCRDDPDAKAYFLGRAKEAVETKANELQENIKEVIEERSAIMQFEAGLPKAEAEKEAKSAIKVYHYRTSEKPDVDLVVIMPNTNLAEAESSLKRRFGSTFISVNEYSAWRQKEMAKEQP
ncbi:hypothetical protein METHB2_790010 [Candidatus Methylobacter favarea]|uniref:Uncharacterized protein n=1 Tax=Candidatus Methylobacter favarea TaxID=2707345 RepID=A0A8S0X9U3_9GAMM|nr:hypothetical protein [Candidatus Methylobacter favarea]CAA9892676.1 hypothetical protein METHB2_790010 [Candidatus Methylobacter favarea]